MAGRPVPPGSPHPCSAVPVVSGELPTGPRLTSRIASSSSCLLVFIEMNGPTTSSDSKQFSTHSPPETRNRRLDQRRTQRQRNGPSRESPRTSGTVGLFGRIDKTVRHRHVGDLVGQRAQVLIDDTPVRTVIEVLQHHVHDGHATPPSTNARRCCRRHAYPRRQMTARPAHSTSALGSPARKSRTASSVAAPRNRRYERPDRSVMRAGAVGCCPGLYTMSIWQRVPGAFASRWSAVASEQPRASASAT